MACSDFSTYREFWINGQFIDGVICPYQDQLGMAVFALIFVGGLSMALYAYTDSLALPLVLAMLVGVVFVGSLPGEAMSIAGVIILVVIMVGGYLLWSRLIEEA